MLQVYGIFLDYSSHYYKNDGINFTNYITRF